MDINLPDHFIKKLDRHRAELELETYVVLENEVDLNRSQLVDQYLIVKVGVVLVEVQPNVDSVFVHSHDQPDFFVAAEDVLNHLEESVRAFRIEDHLVKNVCFHGE